MVPQIDLFHQLRATTKEGFLAITNYMWEPVNTHVYTPQGEWCGCSGATNELSLQADIRHIVKTRIRYEQNKNYGPSSIIERIKNKRNYDRRRES